MMDYSLKSCLKTQHSKGVSGIQCSPFLLQKAVLDICYVSPLAPCCWQIALTQSAGTFTAGFGAKYLHQTDKPWLMSAWLGGLEVNEITINHYSGWFFTLKSLLQKRKSHYPSLAVNVFFPYAIIPLSASHACCQKQLSQLFRHVLGKVLSPSRCLTGLWSAEASGLLLFWSLKVKFSLIILSVHALPLLQPSWLPSSPLPKLSHGKRTPAHGYRQWPQLTS